MLILFGENIVPIKLFFLGFSLNLISQTVPTNGLIAWYPFNGNANDLSGNGLNGIINGSSLTNDRFGNMNAANDFNGLSDFIVLNDINAFDFTPNQDFAISLLVEPNLPLDIGLSTLWLQAGQ